MIFLLKNILQIENIKFDVFFSSRKLKSFQIEKKRQENIGKQQTISIELNGNEFFSILIFKQKN